ncbi:hypothetical protein [Thiothrix sp.]|jgi:hypothetical protein|uniref:hypothetical protein n=1 Tax=Thiothrix sp. TaxID=1032 RepID=UPI00257B7DBD|nr:hypothetical protein [Thiothrix sp.]
MRDLGEMGESIFILWCSQVGLIANGSKIDRTGWDFIVEFLDRPDKNLPLDMQSHPIECKIQVKSTSSNSKSNNNKIKLDNLHRMVTSLQPTFFIFIEFDDDNRVVSAILKHVDEKIIYSVLHRIRKETAINPDVLLNKKYMTINCAKHEDVQVSNGKSLRDGIANFIPYGLEKYIFEKKKILDRVGFENGYGLMKFTVAGKENIESMIDMSLGIKKAIALNKTEFYNSRFGINIKDSLLTTDGGAILELFDIKPVSTGIIRFTDNEFNLPLEFSCDLFISPLSLGEDDEFSKIRIKGDFFDLFIFPVLKKLEFSFSIQEHEFEFKNLYKAIKLLFWINNKSTSVQVEIIFPNMPFMKFNLGKKDDVGAWTKEWNIVESTKSILDYFNILEVNVSFYDLIRFGDSIVGMNAILNTDASKINLKFSLEPDDASEIGECAHLSICGARIGNMTLFLFFSTNGRAELIGKNEYKLNINNLTVHEKIVIPEGKSLTQETIDSILLKIGELYRNSGITTVQSSAINIFTPST